MAKARPRPLSTRYAPARIQQARGPHGVEVPLVGPRMLDREAMACYATVATESYVLMPDYGGDRVIEEVLIARGGVFPTCVPLLDNHMHIMCANVIGGAANFTRRDREWRARLSFTRGVPEAEQTFLKVAQGHITDVSIGYAILAAEEIPIGREIKIDGRWWSAKNWPLRVATKWEVRELSVTPIGADTAAKIRHQRAVRNAKARARKRARAEHRRLCEDVLRNPWRYR